MPTKSWKSTLKICSEFLKSTFFLTALTAQIDQTEEFLYQNVAYWLTVYKTGSEGVNSIENSDLNLASVCWVETSFVPIWDHHWEFQIGLIPPKKPRLKFCRFQFDTNQKTSSHFPQSWNGILFCKLFWPTVQKNCSSDSEILWDH